MKICLKKTADSVKTERYVNRKKAINAAVVETVAVEAAEILG